MTYCVGLKLDRGIVFASDTRTNAGFDNIATFGKMHIWSSDGDRLIALLTAGGAAGVAGLLLCSCRLPVLASGIALCMYLLFQWNKAISRRFIAVAAINLAGNEVSSSFRNVASELK